MDKEIIKNLEIKRQYHIDAIIEQLLHDGNLADAKKHKDWLEISDPIIENYNKTKNFIFWYITIAFICLLIIGLGWAVHIKQVQLSFEVISPNVNFKLSENWKLTKSLKLTNLFINNLNTVHAPDIDINFSRYIDGKVDFNQDSATLEMNGKSIWLKELKIPKGALIDLELENNRLLLYSKGKPLAGKIVAENAEFLLLKTTEEDDEENIITVQDLETISFTSSEPISDPVKLKLKYSCSLAW